MCVIVNDNHTPIHDANSCSQRLQSSLAFTRVVSLATSRTWQVAYGNSLHDLLLRFRGSLSLFLSALLMNFLVSRSGSAGRTPTRMLHLPWPDTRRRHRRTGTVLPPSSRRFDAGPCASRFDCKLGFCSYVALEPSLCNSFQPQSFRTATESKHVSLAGSVGCTPGLNEPCSLKKPASRSLTSSSLLAIAPPPVPR